MKYAIPIAIGLNVSVMVSSFAMQQPLFDLDIAEQIKRWEPLTPFIFSDTFPATNDHVLPQINEVQLIDVVKKSRKVLVAERPTKCVLVKELKPLPTTFLEKLNEHIRSKNFAAAYGCIEKNFSSVKKNDLAHKLMAIVFKEVNSIDEFCHNLIAFPKNTGAMVIAFAYFGKNQHIINDYENCKYVTSMKRELSPLILSLMENHEYGLPIDC